MPNIPHFLAKEKIQALIAQAKEETKNELRAEFKNTEPTPNYDDDTLTVYFFNGSFVGVGKGLLEGESFLEWNGARPAWFDDFFEADEFSIVEENARDKNGNEISVGGAPVKEYFTKFYSHPFMHGKGVTAGGDEYEYFSIGRHGAHIAGYQSHAAFSKPNQGGESTYCESILIGTYQLSEVTDDLGVTHLGSFKGGMPVAEIGEPQIVVHPKRGYKQLGMRWEMQWLDILEAIVMGRRGEGYQSSASLDLTDHFCGDLSDLGGVTLGASHGNSNEAGNTFSLSNDSAYASLGVGAEVTFGGPSNVYAARTSSDGRFSRTITAKEVGESYTVFTFGGEAANVYGLILHASYMAATGATASISESVPCGYRTEYPVARQPFKVLNVEKPWGSHANWLDWLRTGGSATNYIGVCQTTSTETVDNVAWADFFFSGMATGGNWLKEHKHFDGPFHVILPGAVYNGDAVTYYGVKEYWQNQGRCILSGRNNQDNYQHGGQFSFCSCCNGLWNYVAYSGLFNGCWGRVFRTVRQDG